MRAWGQGDLGTKQLRVRKLHEDGGGGMWVPGNTGSGLYPRSFITLMRHAPQCVLGTISTDSHHVTITVTRQMKPGVSLCHTLETLGSSKEHRSFHCRMSQNLCHDVLGMSPRQTLVCSVYLTKGLFAVFQTSLGTGIWGTGSERKLCLMNGSILLLKNAIRKTGSDVDHCFTL